MLGARPPTTPTRWRATTQVSWASAPWRAPRPPWPHPGPGPTRSPAPTAPGLRSPHPGHRAPHAWSHCTRAHRASPAARANRAGPASLPQCTRPPPRLRLGPGQPAARSPTPSPAPTAPPLRSPAPAPAPRPGQARSQPVPRRPLPAWLSFRAPRGRCARRHGRQERATWALRCPPATRAAASRPPRPGHRGVVMAGRPRRRSGQAARCCRASGRRPTAAPGPARDEGRAPVHGGPALKSCGAG